MPSWQRLVDEPVSDEELKKAVKQVRAQFAYSAESVTQPGLLAGAFPRWSPITPGSRRFLDRLAAVTPADVQELAGRMLRRSNRITGWYTPRKKARGKRSAK